MNLPLKILSLTTIICATATTHLYSANPYTQPLKTIDHSFIQATNDKNLVGAQLTIALHDEIILSKGYGAVALKNPQAVDSETLFLIGSCSKPFAAFCLLSLSEDPHVSLKLSDSIDQWLPAFSNIDLINGTPARRSPTVLELLTHRAGIYSQKRNMSAAQAHWIRNFDHTLAKAVDEIASYPLLFQPGEEFAYSGAGYCVLGRVAELSQNQSFEKILQQRLCQPIGLRRTTFFPSSNLPNSHIATGANPQQAPHRLRSKHIFPLIGGSLYSTTEEMVAFTQAITREWKSQSPVSNLSLRDPSAIKQLAHVPSPKEKNYGLGWTVLKRKGQEPRLSHSGALGAYRAWLSVDLETGISIAACWTLAHPSSNPPLASNLKKAMNGLTQ